VSDKSGIEWTDATWNPTRGCTKVSAGCDHCYAETFAERWRGVPGHAYEEGFDPLVVPEKLDQPLRWKRPRRIFVNSMSDLFHDAMPDDYIAQVFAVMACASQHTFQVLTKRHARMRALLNASDFREAVHRHYVCLPDDRPGFTGYTWPLPNVWLGVSVETQQWADIRVPALLGTPAAVRFLSCEPLLGPVTFRWAEWQPWAERPGVTNHLDGLRRIDWVIVGGESGAGARPMHPEWARTLRDECVEAGVPFFFKQWGEWRPGAMGADLVDRPARVALVDAVSAEVVPWRTAGPPSRTQALVSRVGKKAAGRLLDGVSHDGYPEVR
jgi:protein gp37